MTTPVGPNAPQDAMGLMTDCTVQLTISTSDFDMADYFNAGIAREIIPQADGTIYAKKVGDTSYLSRVCLKGIPMYGRWKAIASSGAGSTSGLVLNLGV